MSDEEKKAIDEINRELTDEDRREYMNKWFADDLQTLVNLIEKQQKEIELKNLDLTTVYLNGVYDGEKKVQDKIKAKIEVLEKLQKEFPNNDEIRIKIIAYKELLGEKE